MTLNNSETPLKCGYVAVLGQPNAGKSTLVNWICHHKVSIVSPKVQTTRRRVLGIQIFGQTQMILVDTPGLFEAKRPLETAIVHEAWQAPKDADVILFLVDSLKKDHAADLDLIAKMPKDIPLVVAFNKVDSISDKEHLLKIAQPFNELNRVAAFFMISSIKGTGVEDMVNHLSTFLPFGPWLFDGDQISDAPKKLWASEMTREQLYLQLDNELPYETCVETESYEVFENGSVKINQAIIVAKASQKAIVVGKGGGRIKSINMKARSEMEKYLQQKVHLFLFVKIKEQWTEKKYYLQELFN